MVGRGGARTAAKDRQSLQQYGGGFQDRGENTINSLANRHASKSQMKQLSNSTPTSSFYSSAFFTLALPNLTKPNL